MSPVTFTKDNSFIINYQALWSLQLGPQKTSWIISEEGGGSRRWRENEENFETARGKYACGFQSGLSY